MARVVDGWKFYFFLPEVLTVRRKSYKKKSHTDLSIRVALLIIVKLVYKLYRFKFQNFSINRFNNNKAQIVYNHVQLDGTNLL